MGVAPPTVRQLIVAVVVYPVDRRIFWAFAHVFQKISKLLPARTHKPVAPQVCNYPVQNLATAEIVPIAIVALYKECKRRKIDVKFVNTIHDSVVCYVRDNPGNLLAFRHVAEWAFTTAVYEHLSLFYRIEFDVPLGMEMVTGDHWNEGTETVYDDVYRRKHG